VEIEDFAQYHAPALETNEARHNLILAILARAASDRAYAVRAWSLGAGGACAVQYPGWPIVLGELEEPQCWALAEQLRDIDFPGVVGPDRTASWFADRARRLGITNPCHSNPPSLSRGAWLSASGHTRRRWAGCRLAVSGFHGRRYPRTRHRAAKNFKRRPVMASTCFGPSMVNPCPLPE
jgi:hypothetical protein